MKILFVMTEGIGNMVMALPTIQALCRLGFEVSLLGKALSMEIVSEALCQQRHEIGFLNKANGFDYIGLSMWPGRIEIKSSAKKIFANISKGQHETVANFQIARHLGYQKPMPMPICAVEPFAHKFEKNAIAVCDGYANEYWARKSWPNMMQLVSMLLDAGYPVYLVGDQRDSQRQPLDDELKRNLKLHDLRGLLTIRQSSYLLSKMACVIANDTGMAHVAASHGVPILVLFGATSQNKNRPLGERVQVISADLECSPCQYKPDWAACQHWNCMKAIKAEDVYEKVLAKKRI